MKKIIALLFIASVVGCSKEVKVVQELKDCDNGKTIVTSVIAEGSSSPLDDSLNVVITRERYCVESDSVDFYREFDRNELKELYDKQTIDIK
jgi:hypothetical protein